MRRICEPDRGQRPRRAARAACARGRPTRDELLRFHTAGYLDRVAALSEAGHGDAGDYAPVGPCSYEIAALAAGACLTAVDAVLDGRRSTTPTRSSARPGHHALADTGMGGCIFGNTALAALHARQAHGVERIAIVDWDAHHGNGTQAAFCDDPTCSRSRCTRPTASRPTPARVDELGGEGAGANINLPLPPGSGVGRLRSRLRPRRRCPRSSASRPSSCSSPAATTRARGTPTRG